MFDVVRLELRRRRLVRLRDRLLAELDRGAETPAAVPGRSTVREQLFDGPSVALVSAGRPLRSQGDPPGRVVFGADGCVSGSAAENERNENAPATLDTSGGVSQRRPAPMTETNFGVHDADPAIASRTILVHLNVEVGPEDARTAEQIGAYLDDALSVGLECHDGAEHLTVTVALVDEVA